MHRGDERFQQDRVQAAAGVNVDRLDLTDRWRWTEPSVVWVMASPMVIAPSSPRISSLVGGPATVNES